MPASQSGRESIVSLRKHLSAKGEQFIADHPFYGMEEFFPKAFAEVRTSAQLLSDGKIDETEADRRVIQAMDDECEEHLGTSSEVKPEKKGIFESLFA